MKPPGERPDLGHSIAQVERRIELRRERIARHVGEVRDEAAARAKPMALAAVCAVAVAAFIAGKRDVAPAPEVRRVARKPGLLLGLLAAIQGIVSLLTNPLVRSAWNGFTRRRV
jgi:hypothetical protein